MYSYSIHYHFYSFSCFNALTAASFDATGNEHIEKDNIPTTSHIAKPRRQDRQSASGEVQSMVVDAATARQILELERKLRFQLKETERARDDANKWTSLYHTEVERAEKAEGLLSLRDASIIDYKALLAKKIAQIKLLKKKLFDKSSEKGALTPSSSQPASTGPAKKNKRGKKKGAPGFGRNNHDGLATGAVITTNVSVADMVCADCGAAECPVGFEESKDVEVEVKAYKRLLRRQKVGHFCKCKKKWTTKTARAHAKLIKRGGYAISFWIFCLLGKFVFHTRAEQASSAAGNARAGSSCRNNCGRVQANLPNASASN